MNTHTRTPLQASSPSVERDSAGKATPPGLVRAPLPFPEPRNHGEEIRNLLAQHEAETHAYQCRPDIRPDQSARFFNMRRDGKDDRWPSGWWIAPAIAIGAMMWAGIALILWGIFG